MNKRHYEHTLPNIRGSLSNTYIYSITMRSNDAEIGGENGQSVTIEPWGSSESDVTLVPVK